MKQICEINIFVYPYLEERGMLISFLQKQFSDKKNCIIDNIEADIEIVDDEPDFIGVNIFLANECEFVAGSPSSRYEPGEPAYIEGLLTEEDFENWINKQFKYLDYDVDYSIPSEEDMMEEYDKERENSYYYEEY